MSKRIFEKIVVFKTYFKKIPEMNLDPIDFFPGYDPYILCTRQRIRRSNYTNICTHLLAMIFAIGLCGGAYYYYETYVKNGFDVHSNGYSENSLKDVSLNEILNEVESLREQIEQINAFGKHLDNLFKKIYDKQEIIFDKKVELALETYDADKIGLFDYASIYACGSIISTPDTFPYPANKTISFFKLLNVNLMSDPQSLLQPNNLPGNCFAFYGTTGKIRIKLGQKIQIQAVTLDHVKFVDDNSSAPKEFEVFGLNNPYDIPGVSLGQFTYDINGKAYQTFLINNNLTVLPFEYVELNILSNYGKKEFTCVYRFRVHKFSNKEHKHCTKCIKDK